MGRGSWQPRSVAGAGAPCCLGSRNPGPLRRSWGYLFRWSRRKRKVSRLASGSDSSKLSMQLSFATGSDRAMGDGVGEVLVSGSQPSWKPFLGPIRGHRTAQACHHPDPHGTGPRGGPRDGCLFCYLQGRNGIPEPGTGGAGQSCSPSWLGHSHLRLRRAQGTGSQAWNVRRGFQGLGNSLITLCTLEVWGGTRSSAEWPWRLCVGAAGALYPSAPTLDTTSLLMEGQVGLAAPLDGTRTRGERSRAGTPVRRKETVGPAPWCVHDGTAAVPPWDTWGGGHNGRPLSF